MGNNNNDNTSQSIEKPSTNYAKEIFQWIVAILAAVIIAFLIRGFIGERVLVDGASMENTLKSGQSLILYKLGYYFSAPKRGDIVVLKYQEGIEDFLPFIKEIPFLKNTIHAPREIDYIKRVIGIPGDIIDIKDGFVYLNGEKLDEPYKKGVTNRRKGGMDFPQRVPQNKVFVLGDNREVSSDSRQSNLGFVDYSRIKGKAVFRILPLKTFGGIYDAQGH